MCTVLECVPTALAERISKALRIPVICMPASIDNNLPGWEMSVGADTALNAVVSAIDVLKQSASASRRAFVVETMGRKCGFLAAMSAMRSGSPSSIAASRALAARSSTSAGSPYRAPRRPRAPRPAEAGNR